MQKIPGHEPAFPSDNAPEIDHELAQQLSSNWGWVLFRGIVSVLFGFLALISPWITALSLVIVFGAYALVDGFFAISSIFVGRRAEMPWWALLIEGILGILAAIIAFASPGLGWLSLVWVIGGWLIAGGLVEIITAVRLMHDIDNEWWMIFAGLLSIIVGVLFFVRPLVAGLVVVYVLAFYAVLFGVLLIAFALRLRHWRPQPITPTLPSQSASA